MKDPKDNLGYGMVEGSKSFWALISWNLSDIGVSES